MTVSTNVKNRESIALGLAEIFLADSASNITSFDPIYDSTSYVGAKTKVAFNVTKTALDRYKVVNDVRVLFDQLVVEMSLSFSVEFIEITKQNVSYSFGGNNVETNVLNDLLFQPKEHRAEMVFTYPNKVNQMVIILPRTKIIQESIEGGFASENPIALPMTINALVTDDVNWSSDKMGRILFLNGI